MTTAIPITVLSQLYYPELISTGQIMTELCEDLAKKGCHVRVICAPPTLVDQKSQISKTMVVNNVSIQRVWSTRFPKLSFYGKLINHLSFFIAIFFNLVLSRQKSIRIVFTNPPFLAIIPALLRFFGGSPFIYTIYDVYPDTANHLGVLSAKNPITWIWRKLNQFVYSQASYIVVIGRCMEGVIKKELSTTQQNKLRRIHIFNDEKQLIKSIPNLKKNPLIERWNLKNKFVISYSGNMGRFHDMETIMSVVELLQPYEDIVFLFIGEGYKKKQIMKFAAEKNLKNCQFHGYVDREELGASLSLAQIGLVSLLKNQVGLSVPSKAMGLMAAGVPIVGILPKQSEIALIINEEACGYVCDNGAVADVKKSLLALYNDAKLQQEMSERGRKALCEKYSLNAAANAYKDLINSIV